MLLVHHARSLLRLQPRDFFCKCAIKAQAWVMLALDVPGARYYSMLTLSTQGETVSLSTSKAHVTHWMSAGE